MIEMIHFFSLPANSNLLGRKKRYYVVVKICIQASVAASHQSHGENDSTICLLFKVRDRIRRQRFSLLKVLSSIALNTFRNGVDTTSLDNLFQCLITLIVRTSPGPSACLYSRYNHFFDPPLFFLTVIIISLIVRDFLNKAFHTSERTEQTN